MISTPKPRFRIVLIAALALPALQSRLGPEIRVSSDT